MVVMIEIISETKAVATVYTLIDEHHYLIDLDKEDKKEFLEHLLEYCEIYFDKNEPFVKNLKRKIRKL